MKRFRTGVCFMAIAAALGVLALGCDDDESDDKGDGDGGGSEIQYTNANHHAIGTWKSGVTAGGTFTITCHRYGTADWKVVKAGDPDASGSTTYIFTAANGAIKINNVNGYVCNGDVTLDTMTLHLSGGGALNGSTISLARQ